MGSVRNVLQPMQQACYMYYSPCSRHDTCTTAHAAGMAMNALVHCSGCKAAGGREDTYNIIRHQLFNRLLDTCHVSHQLIALQRVLYHNWLKSYSTDSSVKNKKDIKY